MKLITLIFAVGMAAVVAAQNPAFISVSDPACEGAASSLLYDAIPNQYGIATHNDYHGPGESGSVYHHYSLDQAGPSFLKEANGQLCLEGSAIGGVPSGLTIFGFCCDTYSADPFPVDGPITGNDCSGFYLHNGNLIPIEGKMNGEGVELSVTSKYGVVYSGAAWFTFTPLFDPNGVGSGDFLFKLGCGPVCGDGNVDPDEYCDDGNDDEFDGCRSDCTGCGDGDVQSAYETCEPGIPLPSPYVCSPECNYCGDGTTDAGEQCDPNNDQDPNQDVCRSDCSFCGDGVVDTHYNETCDPQDANGPANCRDDCTYCGDGVIQIGLETCDPADNIPDLCNDQCNPPQNPGCPPEDAVFRLDICSTWVLENGHDDAGIYARNSLWWDWDPRPFTDGGVFNYCFDPFAQDISINGQFDNKGEICDITYQCTSVVQVNDKLTEGTSCSGTMTCGANSLDIYGKASGSGSEVDCFKKYDENDPICVGWIRWDLDDGYAVGDLVWTGSCPPV